MNEIVFKPKHNWFSIVFLGLLIASFGGASLFGGYALDNKILLFIGLIFILMGFYSVARRSTLIVVSSTGAVMKRLLLPPLNLEYEKFTDFTGLAFIFGNTGIPLDDMTNAQEFVDVFMPVLEKKNIHSTGKYVADVNRTNKAMKYAVIPSFIITLISIYILKVYFKIAYDGKLVGGLIFMIVLFVIYFILQKFEEHSNED